MCKMRPILFCLCLSATLSLSAQDPGPDLYGWRPFSLPGLPESEQIILSEMLASNDPSLVQLALQEVFRGVREARISPQSPEYEDFLRSVVLGLNSRASAGSSQDLSLRLPGNMLVLVDLVSQLPEATAQNLAQQLVHASPEIIVFQKGFESFAASGKLLDLETIGLAENRLRRMALGLETLDEAFLKSLLNYWIASQRNRMVSPPDSMVRVLIQVAERMSNSRLRQEIFDTLRLLFPI